MVSNANASVATRRSHDLTILAAYPRAIPPRRRGGSVLAGSLTVCEALGTFIQAGREGPRRDVRVGFRAHRRPGATAGRRSAQPAARSRPDHEVGHRRRRAAAAPAGG